MTARNLLRRPRLQRRWLLLAVAFVIAAPGMAGGQAIQVPNSVIAGGGGTSSAGQFRLTYSIGEPTACIISSGTTTVTSGFLATFVGSAQGAPDDGRIFADGFEGN